MNLGQHRFGFVVGHEMRIAKAWRNDQSWGHAIELEITSTEGDFLNQVVFVCHPEFNEFDTFQAKTTEQLICTTREMLESGRYEKDLAAARSINAKLILRFNSPSSELHRP